MAISLIEMEHDSKKHRWCLWSKGNYVYEIENRHTGFSMMLNLINSDDSLAEARSEFKLALQISDASH